MTAYSKTTLGAIAVEKYGLVDGPFGSNLPAKLYTKTGIPVIRGVNLSLGKYRFNEANFKFVSEETANMLRRSNCVPRDIVFTKKGTIGQTGIIPIFSLYNRFLLSSNQMKLTVNREMAVPEYVYYYVSSPSVREKIIQESTSAGVPKTNITYLREFPIELPPFISQQKIASILTTYDNLIENNLQRMKILEEMAQNLYQEWFVNLRFPGYEKVKMLDSPLGKIPEGWNVLSIKELGGKVVLGGTPARKSSLFWDNGSIPWLKSGKLNDLRVIDGSELITDSGLQYSATKIMPPKTVLIAITGAILISFLEIEACANQSVVGIFGLKKCSQEYLHLYLGENITLLTSKMSGSAQQHINKMIVEDTPILVPSEDIMAQHYQIVKPQYDLVSCLLHKNKVLISTRDLLLTRLISGELDVSELDIETKGETV